jgi:hypothetical protein
MSRAFWGYQSFECRSYVSHRRGRPRSVLEPLEERRLLTVDFTYASTLSGQAIYREISQSYSITTPTVQMATNATGSFHIELEKSPALLANTAMSQAFDRAAEFLESVFFDPITVIVDANTAPLGPSVLGSTGSTELSFDYQQLRNLMVADADDDEGIVSQLPATLPTVSLPPDPLSPFTLTGAKANRANLKALGVDPATLGGPASQYNPSVIRDMSMTFSSDFDFDFDPTDGINSNQIDFVGVAIHEMLHGLGFVSSVDDVDYLVSNSGLPRNVEIGPLDLFRFDPGVGASNFTGGTRNMLPGGNPVVYDGGIYNPQGFTIPGLTLGDIPMSTGDFNGDGFQASHFKADDITHVTIGIMDPTTGNGQLDVFSAQDKRMMGLLGYDLTPFVAPVELSVTGDSKAEGDTGVTELVFTISASNTTIEEYTVTYTTADISATAGEDYEPVSGTLTFTPDGPLTQTVTVQVFGDQKVEDNESFRFLLSEPTGPAALGIAEAYGVILNDDVEVSINDVVINEGNQGTRDAVFKVTAFGAVSQNIVVTYTTLNQTAQGGADYQPRAGQVTLTPLAPSALISVPIIGDRLNEGTETFLVVLTNSQGARLGDPLGQATILDEDPLPALYISDAQVTTTAAGTYQVTFSIALDTASGRQVDVNYSTADYSAITGVDYIGKSGVVSFAPGVTNQLVTVDVMTSGVAGGNKRFSLNATGVSNATLSDPSGDCYIVYAEEPQNEFIIDNGGPGYTRSYNGWTTLTNTLAYQLDYDYASAGNGSAAANWNFTSIPNGTYQIFTRWSQFTNRATNAPFTVYSGLGGNTELGTTLVNEQLAPAGDFSNGVAWQSIGTFEVTSNTLRVRLTNNANGYVVGDAIRIIGGGVGFHSGEIDVDGFGRSISTGDVSPSPEDATDFGSVPSLGVTIERTFTITNNGNADLVLTGSPFVSIGGPNAADFTVTQMPAPVIAPGGHSDFKIAFRATDVGYRTAAVSIANTDDSENPFKFVVQGYLAPAAAALAHNSTLPEDVNDDGRVNTSDALLLINHLLTSPAASPLAASAADGVASPLAMPTSFFDVVPDGRINASDLLSIFNRLISQQAAAAPLVAQPSSAQPLVAGAADAALVLFDLDDGPADEQPITGPVVLPVEKTSPTNPRAAAALLAEDESLELTSDDESDPADEVDFAFLDI